MLTEQRPSVRIGINAQKLSRSQSYHAAGSSRYVSNLVRELRAIDAPEQVIAYVREAHVPPELSPTRRFRIRPSRWPTDHPMARIAWEQLVLPRLLDADRVSLLHGPVNAVPLVWRGKSIVTILDLAFLAMPSAFNRANRAYLIWMVHLAARRADRVITISESTRQDVIRLLHVDPQRVVRVHLGVDARLRPIDDQRALAAFRSLHGLPDGYILYLGTIEPRKNLVRLIDAYAELRRRGVTTWPLVLAGGRGWGDDPIFQRAEQTGLGESIRFVGFVRDDEMPLWYNAASLFVYPSEYEGFGLPPLEALACGTPVVASNSSSLPEVLGEAAVLVDPTATSAIVEGMQRLIEEESLRARLSSAGPPQAKAFTWQRMAGETLAVYRAVGEFS